jgi:hypothetical protein
VAFGNDAEPSANAYASEIEAALSKRGPTEWPCRREGNYLECDDSFSEDSDTPKWLRDAAMEDAGIVTDIIGAMPIIGAVWNRLMDWIWAKGGDARRKKLRRLNEKARRFATNSMQRVFYLKIEDAVRALGYGPLLDFLGSVEWLNWEANVTRPRHVEGDGYGSAPWTPAQMRENMIGWSDTFGGDQVQRWIDGPDGLAYAQEEGPPNTRRLIGGQGWPALITFLAGANRRGGTSYTGDSGAWNLADLQDKIPPALYVDSRFEVCDPYSNDEEEWDCRRSLAWSVIAIAAITGRRGLPPNPEAGIISLEYAYAAELRYLRQRGRMPNERTRFVVNQSNVTQRPCPPRPAAVAAYYFDQNQEPLTGRFWCSQTNSQMRDLAIAAGVQVATLADGRYRPQCVTAPARVSALYTAQTGDRLGRDNWCVMSAQERAAWMARAGLIADPFTGQQMAGGGGYSAGAGASGEPPPGEAPTKSKAPIIAGIGAAALGVWFLTKK